MQTCLHCERGYYCPEGLHREVCGPGYHCPGQGTVAPPECEEGAWCDGTVMNMCPHNSWAPGAGATQQDCLCLPGYTGSRGGLCEECPMDHWCPGGSDVFQCTADALSAHVSSGPSDCYCKSGFRAVWGGNNTEPFVCESIPGSDGPCPDDVGMVPLAGTDVCVCRGGYYRGFQADGSDGCVLCPENHYCSGGEALGAPSPQRRRRLMGHGAESCPANSTAPPGTNHSQGCTCDRGFYGPMGGPCELCPANSWCWGGVENLCPLETPISPAGVSWPENCTCLAGEYCKLPTEPTNKQVAVSSYARAYCYIDAGDHGLNCWGVAFDEWTGGSGQMYSVPLPPGRHAIDVKVGSLGDPDVGPVATHVCVHLDDLTVKCFGSNVDDMLASGYGVNGTSPYRDTTDDVRAFSGLKFAANSLVYANSGFSDTPSDDYAHFCGVNDAYHTITTCWGTQEGGGWSTTKYFPKNVRGLFAYASGTFAVLEDNSVYQWGQYTGVGQWVVGEGEGGPQSFRRWYPSKTVRSIVPVGLTEVCFRFTDDTFACAGRGARNIDFSRQGAQSAVATARYFPLTTFGSGKNGTQVTSVFGATLGSVVYILYASDEIGVLDYDGAALSLGLLNSEFPPDPSNPVIKLVPIFRPDRSLHLVVVVRADGSWFQEGTDVSGAASAIAGKTDAIPLLEYGMQDMAVCTCALCENGYFCSDGGHRQRCSAGGRTNPTLGSMDETSCVSPGM